MGRPSHAFGCDKGDRVKQSQGPPLHGDLRERLGDIARSRRENDSRNNSETRENDQDRGFREFQFQKNYGIKQLAKLDFLESGFQTSFKIPKKQETKESLKITEEITNKFGKILLEKEKPRSKSAKQRQRKKTRKAAEKEKHESESDNEICMKHKKEQQEDCTCKKCLNETCKKTIQRLEGLTKKLNVTTSESQFNQNKACLKKKVNTEEEIKVVKEVENLKNNIEKEVQVVEEVLNLKNIPTNRRTPSPEVTFLANISAARQDTVRTEAESGNGSGRTSPEYVPASPDYAPDSSHYVSFPSSWLMDQLADELGCPRATLSKVLRKLVLKELALEEEKTALEQNMETSSSSMFGQNREENPLRERDFQGTTEMPQPDRYQTFPLQDVYEESEPSVIEEDSDPISFTLETPRVGLIKNLSPDVNTNELDDEMLEEEDDLELHVPEGNDVEERMLRL